MVEQHSLEFNRKADEIAELFKKRLAQMTTYRDNQSLPESEREEVEVDASNYSVWLYMPHPVMKWEDCRPG